MPTVFIILSDDLHAQLRQVADRRNVTLQSVVKEALIDYATAKISWARLTNEEVAVFCAALDRLAEVLPNSAPMVDDFGEAVRRLQTGAAAEYARRGLAYDQFLA